MAGVEQARAAALAVLRVRGAAVAVACLPAALAVVLWAGAAIGTLAGSSGWSAALWVVTGLAAAALLYAGVLVTVLARARPAVSPTVDVPEDGAADLYRLVRELADRLEVPAPSRIALTPDCDSWLEERPEAARQGGAGLRGGWSSVWRRERWRRERWRPVLVLGSPFLWWMRVPELRALLAPVVAGGGAAADSDVAAARRFVRGLDAALASVREPAPGSAWPRRLLTPLARVGLEWSVQLLLGACRVPVGVMERAVATWSSEHARQVDYGLRVAAQEQVGLAYAGWDRLLTRVALPAWRMGRWPEGLNAGVVSALTELSRRDRLVEGFESRLRERPSCDLVERPGDVDRASSALAARLFFGAPAESGIGWVPVGWDDYSAEIVHRGWRMRAGVLHQLLGGSEPRTVERVVCRLLEQDVDGVGAELQDWDATWPSSGEWTQPLFAVQPPRTGRELLAEHVAAVVCCAVVDAAGGSPGLDWLDGPSLFLEGRRCTDLTDPVRVLVDDGDDGPLREWARERDIPWDKPVRFD